jgi:hypothetical protein
MQVATNVGPMAANGSQPDLARLYPHPHAPSYCAHDRAREIRMYMPYAEANAVRLRLMLASEGRWRHVSSIYQIRNGWAWTLCNECPPHDARREAVGE